MPLLSHLKADLGGAPEGARHVRIQGDDEAMSAAFINAVAAVAATWRAGAMFARVEEPNREDGRGCAFCSVKEACLRDDTAVRRRLVAWLTTADPAEAPIEAAARRLWRLGFEAPEEAP